MFRFLVPALQWLTGTTMLVSGILKLYPIEPFELNFIDLGFADWNTAPYLTRLLIATELFLGGLLCAGIYLRTFTVPATAVLLILFSFYLLVELATDGNRGNCGCFGTFLEMTPLQSLVKNFLLLTLLWILYQLSANRNIRFQKLWVVCILLVSLALPVVLNPMDLSAGAYRLPESQNFRFPAAWLTDEENHTDTSQLMQGKHLVALLSLTCPHCETIAFKMHVMKERHPNLPFLFVLNGKEERLNRFHAATHSENIDYQFLHGKNFFKLTGGTFPMVYWLENGQVVRKSNYISLEEKEILKWLDEDDAAISQ